MKSRFLMLSLLASLVSGRLAADTSVWTNTAGGAFSVAGNWSPNQVPGLTDDVTFNLGAAAPYVVTVDAPVTNKILLVQKDKLLLDLSGGPYALSDKLSVESGLGPSELTITGGVLRMYGVNANYTQIRSGYPAGRLELTLAGRDEGAYSRLEVDGTMTLAGTCAVGLADGFKPAIGDSFHLLKWKTLAAGRFADVELPTLSGGKSWVTNDLYVAGTISVDGTRGTTLFVR